MKVKEMRVRSGGAHLRERNVFFRIAIENYTKYVKGLLVP